MTRAAILSTLMGRGREMATETANTQEERQMTYREIVGDAADAEMRIRCASMCRHGFDENEARRIYRFVIGETDPSPVEMISQGLREVRAQLDFAKRFAEREAG